MSVLAPWSARGGEWSGWNSEDNRLSFGLVQDYIDERRLAIRRRELVLVDTDHMIVWQRGMWLFGYFHRSLFDWPASSQQPT